MTRNIETPRRAYRIRLAAVVLCLLVPLSVPADLVVRCNLADLQRDAGTVFHGRCIERKEVRDAQPLPYVEYTFEVTEALKGCRGADGKPLRRIRFRHVLDRPARRLPDGTIQVPLRFGVARYAVGETRVLFLTEESELGLCAPVGLDQGAFVVREKANRRVVTNRFGNRHLFEGLPAESTRRVDRARLRAAREAGAELALDRFLEISRSLEK